MAPARLHSLYQKLPDFQRLLTSYDPQGKFRNPFLDHKLSDIALHHEKKMQMRLVPTRDEYVRLFGKQPKRLAEIL